jgi:predicted dehydrogenase
MLSRTKPDVVIVTTVDAEHDKQIVTALEMGADVITEKPMTTDEVKCKAILDAEKRTGRKVIVAFNYRHGPHPTKIKELLSQDRIGKVTSVDFNWYLNVYHGADYFRRWHGLKHRSGSLWVHKSTHHFDLLNWWLDSDPVEVTAYGKLEHYGKNNPFRGKRCMGCEHKDKCRFYWDITKDDTMMKLYVANEKYDGYIRDNCVFREEIDIYDKMSAQIVYANGVTVNYSLTTYSPYEGWRLSFNGTNGKLDTWLDIPYQPTDLEKVSQEERHAIEMSSAKDEKPVGYAEIIVADNFKTGVESVKVPKFKGGHGGGDVRMHDRLFRDTGAADPFRLMAGTRDGAMSLLIGVAARKSIDEKRPVKISELTDIKPLERRPFR